MILQIIEENNEPVIKLAGLQLSENGFKANDYVKIRFSDNQIVISKTYNTEKLQSMERINPSIAKLMKEFNLDLLNNEQVL